MEANVSYALLLAILPEDMQGDGTATFHTGSGMYWWCGSVTSRRGRIRCTVELTGDRWRVKYSSAGYEGIMGQGPRTGDWIQQANQALIQLGRNPDMYYASSWSAIEKI